MPTIPRRTTARIPRGTSLGRISDVNAPGLQKQSQLNQLDALGRAIGGNLVPALLARQDKIKADNDLLNISEANLKFKNSVNEELIRVNTLRGKATEGVTKQFNNFMLDRVGEFSQGLTPDQTEAFKLSTTRLRPNYTYQAAKFESGSRQRRIRADFDGQAASNTTLALINFDNVGAFDEFLAEADAAHTERLKLDGVDEELIEKSVQITHSKTLRGGISRLLTENLAQAKLWFEQAKTTEDLTNNDVLALDAAFKRAENSQKSKDLSAQAQTITDDLVATFGEGIITQREVARERYSGALEDAVINRLNARNNESLIQERETQASLLLGGAQGIRGALNYDEATEVINDIEDSADGATLNQLDRLRNSRFNSDPSKRRTNFKKFQEAREFIDATFKGEAGSNRIRSVDDLIARYEPFTSPSDMKVLIRNFREGGNISGLTNSKVNSAFKLFNPAADLKTESGREDSQEFFKFLVQQLPPGVTITDSFLREQGALYFTQPGRKEIGFWSRIGFGSGDTYQEAQKEGTEKTWLPQLNEDQIETARRRLSALNARQQTRGAALIPDTEENLSEIYKVSVLKLPHSVEPRNLAINSPSISRIR